MMNMNLVMEAVKIVNDYFEAEGIYEQTAVIIKRAMRWYSMTEITSAQALAAVTMRGEYEPGIKIEEIARIEEFFFPTMPIEYNNFSVAEINDSLADLAWM